MIAAFEPPPRLTVSEWADQYRRLSSEASAEAGDWKTDRAPYQRAMMDALTPNSPYERVVVMAASQTGKTELALNFCGYIIDRDPGPTMYVPNAQVPDALNALNVRLMEELNSTGRLYLTHTKLAGRVALRLVTSQTGVTQRHVDAAWQQITASARAL